MPSSPSNTSQALLSQVHTHSRVWDRADAARKRAYTWLDRCETGQLIVAVVGVGCMCGVVGFLYNSILQHFIRLVWQELPQHVVLPAWKHAAQTWSWWPQDSWPLAGYIVLVASVFGIVVGASQRSLGCPGDLPETIAHFHEEGCIPHSQAPSMFVCSLFSVCAGGSLGPEAPLLCLCASAVSYAFRVLFPVKKRMLRYCTLLGMAAGLAAFFGVSMGGAMFALEVPHRMGVEYFEVVSHALAAGVVCLAVFRAFGLQPFGQIWQWPEALSTVDTRHVLVGVAMGFAAAAVAILWTYATKAAKRGLAALGLDEHKTPIRCGVLGGFVIGALGAVLPPTMFWGEFEIKSIADARIALPHVWPGGGVWGLQPFLQGEWTAGMYALIGFAKLAAISVTLFAGFRGGFIFPLFACGAALGTALRLALGHIMPLDGFPVVLFAMSGAAGLNTAITRTPLGTTLILATLSGQPGVSVPCIAAALVALFATKRVPFIMSQRSRADMRTGLSTSSKEPGDSKEHVPDLLDTPIHYDQDDCAPEMSVQHIFVSAQ